MMPFANATVATSRAGQDVYAARKVQIDVLPASHGVLENAGPPGIRLYDEAASDYQPGDTLTLLSVSGVPDACPLSPVAYLVELVTRFGGPLAYTRVQALGVPTLPEVCTIVRGGNELSFSVPARIIPESMEDYPLASQPNFPVTRWQILLPAGQDVQANDLLLQDSGNRIYVVVRTDAPRSFEIVRSTHCILSALRGQLGDAYLRANATVQSMRQNVLVYNDRRVHLVVPQANPAAMMERMLGGVATLHVVIFDLVTSDYAQGDAVQIRAIDGSDVLPGITSFTLGAVLRRPLPFAVCEIDAIADVLA